MILMQTSISPLISVEAIRGRLIDERNVLTGIIDSVFEIRRGTMPTTNKGADTKAASLGMEGIAELVENNRCLISEIQSALSPMLDKPSS